MTGGQVAGRRFLVTGATCPLGVEVCRRLDARGGHVTALVRDARRAAGLLDGIELVSGDCERPRTLRDPAHASSHVLHLAGMRFATAMIQACAGHDELERAVFIGSTRIHYPDGVLAPSERRTKRVLAREEDNVMSSLLPWTILRPTLIFSPRDRSLSRVIRVAQRRGVLPVPGGGRAIKQPISAGDLAESVIAGALSAPAHRMAYDVPGRDVAVREMLRAIRTLVGRNIVLVRVPESVVVLAHWASRATGGRKATHTYLRWYRDLRVSGEPAARDFGHAPRAFADALRDAYEAGQSRERPPLS